MALTGRHSQNFYFFLVVRRVIIPVQVNILKDPILFEPLVLEKVVSTCPLIAYLNSLTSLSKICVIRPHFSAISQYMLQSEISFPLTSKQKDHMQLQKAHHNLWLVAAPFQMARMKITLRVGRRRGPSWGHSQGVHLLTRGDRGGSHN